MNAVERALRDFLTVRPAEIASAVVGGIAVSVRTEPRFTRDLDLAVAVANDDEAANYAFRIRQHGYEIVSALEQTTQHRLSTIRMRREGRGPIVDLLFAACGIEAEIAQAAEPIEIATGLVAEVGHLIAMKLVSRDPKRRPRDQQDLVDLANVADDREWPRAEAASRGREPRPRAEAASRGREPRPRSSSSSSAGSREAEIYAPASPGFARSPRREALPIRRARSTRRRLVMPAA